MKRANVTEPKIEVYPHVLKHTEDLLDRSMLLLLKLSERCGNEALRVDGPLIERGKYGETIDLLYEISYTLEFISSSLESRRDLLGRIARDSGHPLAEAV